MITLGQCSLEIEECDFIICRHFYFKLYIKYGKQTIDYNSSNAAVRSFRKSKTLKVTLKGVNGVGAAVVVVG